MIRCIAIDDEPFALMQIASYVEKTPFLQLVASCRSAYDAQHVMAESTVDLLFVDINMPDLNGLDFVRSLTAKPLIIFTTAYGEFALDGFRVDALDYLLKPISNRNFQRSAEKALRQFNLMKNAGDNPSQTIFVKSEYKNIQIDIDKILYIESRSEYVRIYSEDIRPVMTLGSLKSYEEKLPSDRFMRIHRSYIVILQKIMAVERRSIIINKDRKIPVGELYEERFRAYLSNHSK